MNPKRSPSSLLQAHLLALISPFTPVLAQLDLSHYSASQRWAQASLLLSDNSLLLYGGKLAGTGGYTYSSAPDTNDLLSLRLDSPFSADSPPWQYLSGSQIPTNPSPSPPISYASLAPLLEPTSILSFGGAAPSFSNLTGADSSLIISLPSSPSSSSNLTLITQQSPGWAQQPIRRIRHSSNSASGPDSLRIWLLGGQRADGSQAVFDELWQYSASQSSPQLGTWSACPPAPQAIFDHASVTLLDSTNIVRLYVIGGMGGKGELVDIKTLYRFTPNLIPSSCTGLWETFQLTGASLPTPRRGHSVVQLSATQLMLFGGASASASTVYGDLWVLDLTQLSWSPLLSTGVVGAPSPRWGHSMARVGQRVIVTFGYGAIDSYQPAPTGVSVFDLDSGQWTTTYVPSPNLVSATSMAAAQAVMASAGGVGADAQKKDSPTWQVPGSLNPVKPITIPASHSPARPIITALVGVAVAVFGTLVLVGGSVYLHRYQTRQKQTRRLEAERYRRRAHGPDIPFSHDDHDDEAGGLVYKNESLHATHIGVAAVGGRSGLKALAGVGAFWAQRKRRERFDILADEESEIWDARPAEVWDHRSLADEQDQRRKKYTDGFAERVKLPRLTPMPMTETQQTTAPLITTRGGLRIWRGLDDGSSSQIGFGTSTSFLGASLAPWSDDGRSPTISDVARFDDPFEDAHAFRRQYSNASSSRSHLNPFSDPEGDADGEGDEEELLNERTGLTFASSYPDSNHPTHSTGPLTPATPQPLPAPRPLDRRATWWDRFREKHSEMVDQSTEPIRDPAPPPLMPSPEPEILTVSLVDEHGRRTASEGDMLPPNDESQSSNRTATSSMIHTAEAEMTVVQRVSSAASSPLLESHVTLLSPRDPPPPAAQRLTAGTVGVRAMVEQFEAGKESAKARKVVHGLVKKPVLFVANPDRR